MTPANLRDRANRLAWSQPEEALRVARSIKDDWFKSQALASVGRYWPDAKYGRLLEESLQASDALDDPYKQVALSAWPIRAYFERDDAAAARRHLEKYLSASLGIENMGSRSSAILLLFQAARPFAADLWHPAYRTVVTASEPVMSWRQRRNLEHAVAMVAVDYPGLVHDALSALSDDKTLAAVKHAADKPSAIVRPFFWARGAQAAELRS
jgi:hypothetical protein